MERKQFQIFLYLLTVFIGFFSLSVALPIYPSLFLSNAPIFVGKTLFYGLAISMYPLGQLISAPFFGRLSDAFGRKKLFFVSLFLTSLLFFQTALSIQKHLLYAFLISRFLTGCFHHTFTLSQAAMSDISTNDVKPKRFGFLYFVVSLGFIIGPIFTKIFNTTQIFTFLGILNACLLVFLIPFLKESLKEKRGFKAKEQFFNMRAFKPLAPYFFINFCIYLGIFTYFKFYTAFFINHVDLSYLISVAAVFTAFVQLFLLKILLKRFSERQLMMIFGLIFSLSLMLAVTTQMVFFIYLVASSIGVLLPISNSFISNLLGNDRQGEGLGWNRSMQLFAETFGGITGGYLAFFSMSIPLFCASFLMFLSTLLLYNKKTVAKQL